MSWTEPQEAAYRKRVADIGERFIAWAQFTVTRKRWATFPIQHREDFHDRLMIAIARSEVAHVLPRTP